jgi:hypothetical protein
MTELALGDRALQIASRRLLIVRQKKYVEMYNTIFIEHTLAIKT